MLKRKVSCTFKRKNTLDNQERIYSLSLSPQERPASRATVGPKKYPPMIKRGRVAKLVIARPRAFPAVITPSVVAQCHVTSKNATNTTPAVIANGFESFLAQARLADQ